jgi:glyoxylase-like metal-dependent hydrolase (beta-lactamase superfamily II)/rhodanese-related sulfurtransferase
MIEVAALVDEGLGNSSYLVDLGDGRALVVDPSRDPRPYLALAARHGLRVAFSAETHLHADFVSGSRELAADGARVIASSAGRLEFDHAGVADGDELELGGLTLRALATPGHTPEHLSYLILDGSRPRALFSGGSLLVGAVARTDLIRADRTETLARDLYRSIHARLLSLPDDVAVYPTHGPGSFCSAPATGERTTTIGRERRTNPLLAAPDEDTFVTQLVGGFGSFPDYFLTLREVNRRGPRVLSSFPSLASLGAEEVCGLMQDGAEIVDARPVAAFAAGHVSGSLSIALRPAFASWLGWLVPPDRPIVFVLDADQDADELVRQALTIGYERLAGVINGGIAAWEAAGYGLARIPLVPPERLGAPVLDIRQDSEFAAGHIPDSLHVELGRLADVEPPSGPLVLACGHGERAMTGASLLARRGRREVSVLDGGPADWASRSGVSLVSGA